MRTFLLKAIAIISMVIDMISGFGQCPIAQKVGANYQFRSVGGDSSTRLSKRFSSTCWLDSGAVMYNPPDSSVYTWTGTEWIKLRGASGSSGITQIFGKQHVFITGTDTANFDTLQYRKIYNVVSFGADSTGHLDATHAIISADAIAALNGGGDVYFPRGIYNIAGALQPSCNCQIPIPVSSETNYRAKIRWIGEMANITANGITTAVIPLNTAGVVLRSTISGSGINPSIIGSNTGIGGVLNFTDWDIDNIGIEAYTDHATQPVSINGINCTNMQGWEGYDFFVTIDTTNQVAVSPVGLQFAGIICGQKGNTGPVQLKRFHVSGYPIAIVACEHTTLHDADLFAAQYAMAFPKMDYDVRGDVLIHGCIQGFYWPTVNILGQTPGHCSINLRCEYEIDSVGFGTPWYRSQGNIVDSGQNAYGYLWIDNKESNTSRDLNHKIGLSPSWAGNNLTVYGQTAWGPNSIVLQSLDSTIGDYYQNIHYNPQAVSWVYQSNGPASLYTETGGAHYFRGAPSGTAGQSITQASLVRQLYLGLNGQVGISQESPDASAQLDITSTTRGFLPPRMKDAQKNSIPSPAGGLTVYDTDHGKPSWYSSTLSEWLDQGENAHTIFTPASGGTVALVRGQVNIINPSGPIAALTLVYPTGLTPNDFIEVKFTQAVAAIATSGISPVTPLASATAGQYDKFFWDTSIWY